MPCTRPISAWPAPPGAADRRLVFSPHKSFQGARAISLPCGKCDSCRLSRSRSWATRIVHEAQMHESSCFLTPTFSDENLPADLSVSVRTHQLFLKRLREQCGAFRFFGRGEYGEQFQRPHYHTILFGLDFPDKTPWKKTASGEVVFRSPTLEKVWSFGHCLIGSVNFKSAAYVAGYVNKKAAGEAGDDVYRRFDPETGEVWHVRPEFIVMSRRPGIGAEWFNRFSGDAFPSDFVVIDGVKRSVPRFYRDRLSDAESDEVGRRRKLAAAAKDAAGENTTRRLMARDESARLKASRFSRNLDGEA